MLRFLVVVALIPFLNAQLLVDTFAGGKIPSTAIGNIFSGLSVDTGGAIWDSSGNVVFCDLTYNVIRRLHPDGSIETIAGTGTYGYAGDGGPATSALLNAPKSPRYDPSGNLYFFDSLNARIRRIDPRGIVTTVAGDGQSIGTAVPSPGPATLRPLGNVSDLVADASGNLYFSTSAQMFHVTPAGNLEVLSPQTLTPGELAIDPAGNLYFFDASAGAIPSGILRRSPDGLLSTFTTLNVQQAPHSQPPVSNLKSDPTGAIYVAFSDAGMDHQIRRYAPDGSSTVLTTPGSLSFPSSIDAQGNMILLGTVTPDVYVAIPILQELTAQGQLKTLVGANPTPAPDGTPPHDAWFLNPTSIAFSGTGDLYIAEFNACLIRKISIDGVLSTFAGTGKCGYPAPTGNAKTADLVYPSSIAVDSKNRVWVADYFLNLYSIAQDGTLSTIIKTPVAGGKGQLAIDSKDRVYVLGMDSLYRVLSDGTIQPILPAPPAIGSLYGIGADPSGNVYFAGGNNIYLVNDDGTYTVKSANTSGNSLAVDASGKIWVGGTSSIAVHSAAGAALLGTYSGYSGDGGSAVSAGYSTASSVTLAPNGNLYFLDANRIRRITGSGPSAPPVISQNGIVNAVSYTGGPIAPGELISIFGSNFGVSGLQVNSAVNNTIPFTLGRTRVLFNGFPGPVTAVTPNQINVFVPINESGSPATNVVVQVDDIVSAAVPIALAPAAPGLATLDASGSGPGAIVNQDGTVNSASNPAPRGSVISLYGTGAGRTTPTLNPGALAISVPYSTTDNPVSVTIAGQTSAALYAGDAPSFPTGVFQVNALVPANINPGAVPVSVSVAGTTTSPNVTVFVK